MLSVSKKNLKRALRSFVGAFFSLNALLAQQHISISEVNSASDELHPVFHPSGDLYFTRVSYDQNLRTNEGPGGIWKSRRISERGFSSSVKVNEISTPFYDLLVGFPNHRTAYVYHHHYEGVQGIFVYQLEEDSWQMDSALHIPGLKSLGPFFNARLTQSGQIILMSMQSFGSYGNEDLYVSKWEPKTKTWSAPINLGANINSTYQELTPYFSEEENILFFSSNRPGEGTGFQLFYSVRQDDSFTQWSIPKPLAFLDKEGVTLSYMENPLDGNAFFTSTSSSEGYGDIFLLSAEVKDEIYGLVNTNLEEISQVPPTPTGIRPEADNTPDLSVRDPNSVSQLVESKSITPLGQREYWISEVSIKMTEFKLLNISSTGETESVDSLSSIDYRVGTWILQVPGFIPSTIDWEVPFSTKRLTPAEPGMRIDLSTVQFERGGYQLSDSISLGYIKVIAEFLMASPAIKIGLEGHTDNLGNVELNKSLSTQRATQIRDLLVAYGVAFERIQVSGFGGTRPVADNKTDAGRTLNRRVELVVLDY